MNYDEVAMKGRELVIDVQGHCVEDVAEKDKNGRITLCIN